MMSPSTPEPILINHADATLYHADIQNLQKVVREDSVDIILTDPPYPKDFLACWTWLGQFAEHALKPGGHLFAMSGHVWLPQVLFALDGAMRSVRYNWCLNMGPLTDGGHTNIGRRIVRSTWKPILWYIKPPHSVHEQLNDHVKVNGKDKRFHHWGQGGGEWQFILDGIKRPKPAVICDPFLGGGTTAIVAAEEGYKFLGGDIELECVETTIERLNTRQVTMFTGDDL